MFQKFFLLLILLSFSLEMIEYNNGNESEIFQCKEESGWCMRNCCPSSGREFNMKLKHINMANQISSNDFQNTYANLFKHIISCLLSCITLIVSCRINRNFLLVNNFNICDLVSGVLKNKS